MARVLPVSGLHELIQPLKSYSAPFAVDYAAAWFTNFDLKIGHYRLERVD